jgi:competence protein ComEC
MLSAFVNDHARWILWWPVGLGIGIAIYFSLSIEPSHFSVLSLLIFWLAITVWVHFFTSQRWYIKGIPIIVLSICVGFSVAKLRTYSLSTPFLENKIENIGISGCIIDIEEQVQRHRITLGQLEFDQPISPLHKVRLTLPKTKELTPKIGDRVFLIASLLPLSDPVSLDGYNFRRHAYFQGIGATGRVLSPIKILTTADQRLWLVKHRYHLTQTIRQQLKGQMGEIAAALITGDRSGIHPQIRQAFTDAGLAHILAISGLHLSLVAGLIFLFFRRGLALFPYLAENYPIKKWSAGIVIFATWSYLAISGFGIPGQRAFVMISIVMLGILLDRSAISMRLVAFAATIILTLRPESLLSASFQLSFAAVIGLIAAYEDGWAPLRQWSVEGGRLRRLVAYSAGLIATTLIATLATTPYTLYLFNRITLQAIVGNFLAIPLTSIIIMPAATVSVLSLPFGGWDVSFKVLSFGLSYLISIAQMVASWPGAAITVATPPTIFICLMTLGGLWFCIWKHQWRWAGLGVCVLGCLTLFLKKPADIYVAGDGSVIAYTQDNKLYVSNLKRGGFYTDQWLKELGLTQRLQWEGNSQKIGPILLLSSSSMSKEACSQRILITNGYAWRYCKTVQQTPLILIDRYILHRDGTYQVWLTEEKVIIKSVRQQLGNRSWNHQTKTKAY